jgi:hypothetical protein
MSKTNPHSTKVHRDKSAGKRMLAVAFMKSDLTKLVPLETGAALYASWYVNTNLPQVFKTVSKQTLKSHIELGLPTHF